VVSGAPSLPPPEDVARCAYLLWCSEGCPAGRDQDLWLLAEARLQDRQRRPSGTRRAQSRRFDRLTPRLVRRITHRPLAAGLASPTPISLKRPMKSPNQNTMKALNIHQTQVLLQAGPPPSPGHDDIAQCARLLWEQEGRPEGRDVEHWLQAEARLRSGAEASRGSAPALRV
jgi:hypothetical protein